MGDWATTYHWIETPDSQTADRIYRRLRHNNGVWRYPFDDQWGLRVGFIGRERLTLQVETVIKWGGRLGLMDWMQNTHPDCRTVLCNTVYKIFSVSGPALSGFPAWNCILFPLETHLTGTDALALADLEGRVITTHQHHILHLTQPMPLTASTLHWDFYDLPDVQTPEMRLWEALYACHPDLHTHRPVFLAWWTPLRGYIILGEVYLMEDNALPYLRGGVDMDVTGAFNPILSPFEDGNSTWALPSLAERLSLEP